MAKHNPPCPHCGANLNKAGITVAGYQRWRCRPCRYYSTDTPNSHGGHRHGAIGGTPANVRARRSEARRKGQANP